MKLNREIPSITNLATTTALTAIEKNRCLTLVI